MDIKTLPTILCYVSSATTLNTYSHITDEMQQLVAEKIDRDTAKAEVKQPEERREHSMTNFQARKRWGREARRKVIQPGPADGRCPSGGLIFSVYGQICGQEIFSENIREDLC